MRALEFSRVEILAEADGSRFEESAARAQRRPAIAPEVFEVRLWIAAPVTGLTFDERICAMQFDKAVGTGAGEAMQPSMFCVTTAQSFPSAFQSDHGVMHCVRLGVAEGISSFELVIPMLDPRRFRGHEVLKINRLPSRPDTLWSAKIRNAASGRDAGAGKNERLLRGAQVIG